MKEWPAASEVNARYNLEVICVALDVQDGAVQHNVQRKVEAIAQRYEAASEGLGNGGVTVPETVTNRTGISEQMDDKVFLDMNHPNR